MDLSVSKDATTLNLEEIAQCGNAPYVLGPASLPEAGDAILDLSVLKGATKLNLEEIAQCGNAPYVLSLASLPEAGDARLVLHGDAKVKDVNCPICYFKLEGKKEWRCLPFGDRVSLSVLNDKVDAMATITYFPDSGFSIVSVPAKMVNTLGRRLGVFANVQALWGCVA